MARGLFVSVLILFLTSGCAQVENWLRFDPSAAGVSSSPEAPVEAISSIDDDYISVSTVTPNVRWVHSGLIAGPRALHFEIAIGTTLGANDILTWTSVGTATTWSTTSLVLTVNSTYYASVRIVDAAGTVYSLVQGDGWKVLPSVNTAARYSIAANWNSYANTITPTTVCSGTEQGYFACIHGGEKKRVNYAAANSCVGYSIVDELSAFDWGCDDSGGAGTVFFYSYGLKKSKGLSDLLTATAWRSNRVIVSQAGLPVATSDRTAWWANTVEALPSSSTAGSPVDLSNSRIYTVSDIRTSLGGYRIASGSRELAVVTLAGGKLRTDPSLGTGALLFDGHPTSYFLWYEGDFQGGTTNTSFTDTIGAHSVVRRARLSHFAYGFGDGSQASDSSWISQVRASDNLNSGIRLKGSLNTLQDIQTISNAGKGLQVGDAAHDNIFVNVLTANNGAAGIDTSLSDRNTFIAVTSVNNNGAPFDANGDRYTDYLNIVMKNSGGGFTGISLTESTFAQIVTNTITLVLGSNLKFSSYLVMSGATPDCSIAGGSNLGLISGTCANQGTSNKTLVQNNGFGDTSYRGAVVLDDLSNETDTLGVAPYSAGLNWTQFEHPFRGWGISGVFLTSAMRGVCSSGTCQIWDYRLNPASTQLKNTTGNASTQNAAFVGGSACPAAVGGSVSVVDRRVAPRTFLTNAVEVFGSGGNNNGVCQSFETCIYMPNYGADQGEGDFRAKKCTFTDGTVQGVVLYGY